MSGRWRACGVDVQQNRRCPYVILESASPRSTKAPRCVATGWLENDTPELLSRQLLAMTEQHHVDAVGIDAPRGPLPEPRKWTFGGGRWKRSSKDLVGRHCEVAISSTRLANPQWTPLADAAPAWMELGFALFAAANKACGERVYEVFPSASYRQLAGSVDLRLELLCGDFSPGPKDLLDAGMAALTVVEYESGRGVAVGGGDGLGTIILPRPLSNPSLPVLNWPE